MMRYHEIERRCAERLADLERERRRVRLDTVRSVGGSGKATAARARLAALLLALAARRVVLAVYSICGSILALSCSNC